MEILKYILGFLCSKTLIFSWNTKSKLKCKQHLMLLYLLFKKYHLLGMAYKTVNNAKKKGWGKREREEEGRQ